MKSALLLSASLMSGLIGPISPVNAAGTADQITVVDPYVRLAPPGAKTTAAFMTLRNAGVPEAKLVSAAAPVASATELHNHINDGGVMRMRQVKEIPVPVKGEVQLKPGSYHVMLIDMKVPLKEGDKVAITLGFADGSSKTVDVPVIRPTVEMMPKGMDHSKMKH